MGTFISIGIEKRVPCAPDDRMRQTLTEAATIGTATAQALTFSPREPRVLFYEDRQWNFPLQQQSSLFEEDEARAFEDRTFFCYYWTGVPPR